MLEWIDTHNPEESGEYLVCVDDEEGGQFYDLCKFATIWNEWRKPYTVLAWAKIPEYTGSAISYLFDTPLGKEALGS